MCLILTIGESSGQQNSAGVNKMPLVGTKVATTYVYLKSSTSIFKKNI